MTPIPLNPNIVYALHRIAPINIETGAIWREPKHIATAISIFGFVNDPGIHEVESALQGLQCPRRTQKNKAGDNVLHYDISYADPKRPPEIEQQGFAGSYGIQRIAPIFRETKKVFKTEKQVLAILEFCGYRPFELAIDVEAVFKMLGCIPDKIISSNGEVKKVFNFALVPEMSLADQ